VPDHDHHDFPTAAPGSVPRRVLLAAVLAGAVGAVAAPGGLRPAEAGPPVTRRPPSEASHPSPDLFPEA
jgi:hypothetical protein